MTIAYLLNTYPLISTTFIRREIEALERAGVAVRRYALRGRGGEAVDPADIAEKPRTHYILEGNAPRLLLALLAEIATNPAGLARALGPWFALLRAARGGVVRHVAYLLEAVYFRRRARADGVDHVHVHFMTNAAAVAMLARVMGGPSYSVTCHGPDELTDAPLLDFPAKIGHAAFIVAITHFCKSQLVRFSSIAAAEKIHIVHCALDLTDFEASPPPGNRTFVCVGRLCPQKGQAQIPAAVAALRNDYPDLEALLIGDGESRAEVEAEIERCGVGDRVRILGWKANPEVREAMRNARALLLPSFAEGLPVVIMEAMALGRPVISTYIAGIPELLDRECGWIVPAGSQAALTEAMRGALAASPQDLEVMGAEGRRRIECGHDVDIEAARLKALFDGAAAPRPL